MERVILHSDLNNFYASVECLHNPKIRDKPIAVCGRQEERHGIVLAKNYIAKKYAVQTGETVWKAKNKCPNLIIVQPNYGLYLHFSQLAKEIYQRYTDQVESFGIDECWLDITGSTKLFGTGEKIANQIRRSIKNELGITCSVGVSFNKIFAKLGSDLKKPNAFTVITRNNYRNIVWPLSAEQLLYVGPSTKRKLAKLGIKTIGEIATTQPEHLAYALGKWGSTLWAFANGYDLSPVTKSGYKHPIKSIGSSITVRTDLISDEDIKKTFYILAENIAERLRKHNFKGQTLGIWLRENNFFSQTRQAKLFSPTFLSTVLVLKAMDLFKEHYNWSYRNPLRAVGIRVSNLVAADNAVQLSFYDDPEKTEKLENLEKSIDRIRRRFGHYAIQRAVTLKSHNTTEPDKGKINYPLDFR